ncbi:MAG TPA: hypothetical protein VFI73_08885 [Candidatus Nitrosopolaris sp.]|nr:hypothetical protein [Candidatus Nitrosopolaris sp.]
MSEHGAPPYQCGTTSSPAGSPGSGAPAVVLVGAPAVVLVGTEPNVGTRAAPGIICAMARCCCNGKMLGQIANSTAPKLNTMPKGARDIIPYYRERPIYKGLSRIGKLAIWKL